MTLLLGPPSSGKTTLLLALAGKLDKDLKVDFFFLALSIRWMMSDIIFTSNIFKNIRFLEE